MSLGFNEMYSNVLCVLCIYPPVGLNCRTYTYYLCYFITSLNTIYYPYINAYFKLEIKKWNDLMEIRLRIMTFFTLVLYFFNHCVKACIWKESNVQPFPGAFTFTLWVRDASRRKVLWDSSEEMELAWIRCSKVEKFYTFLWHSKWK